MKNGSTPKSMFRFNYSVVSVTPNKILHTKGSLIILALLQVLKSAHKEEYMIVLSKISHKLLLKIEHYSKIQMADESVTKFANYSVISAACSRPDIFGFTLYSDD